jgi:hypothetical protein
MKHRKKWTILFIGSSSRRPKQFKMSWGVPVCLFIITLVSFVGLTRMSFILVAAAFYKIEHHEVQKEHTRLNQQIAFSEKLVQTYREKLKEMCNYEKDLRRRYDIKEIPDDVRLAGTGGTPSTEERLSSLNNPTLQRAIRIEENISTLLRQVNLEDTLFREAVEHVAMQQRRWGQLPLYDRPEAVLLHGSD